MCIGNIYYVTLYNSALLDGNILVIGITFGVSELIGILFGERIMNWFHPVKGLLFSISVICVVSTFIKTHELTQNVLYFLFCFEVFFLGVAYNIIVIL